MRLNGEELNNVMKKYGVDRLWSWSRFDSYLVSKYCYYLKYIKNVPEDRTDCIYTVTGGLSHTILERFYGGEIEYEDMSEEFEDAWTTAMISELKFDRNDPDKNKKIGDKYYKDLQHFFKNHVPISANKIEIERFISVLVGKNVFQGYIDTLYKDKNGNFVILDWKTSTKFTNKNLEEKTGQLIVYAMGLHQLGVPYDKIKVCFDFLKYVDIDCMQANGKWTTRSIERFEIGDKLQTSVKMWLKKLGYEDQLEEYLDKLYQTNSIDCLPDDVKEKYMVHDCVLYVDVTQDLIDKWNTKIVNTIDEIIDRENQYNTMIMIDSDEAEKIWFDSMEEVEAQNYYFGVLCGYSANLHKPYKIYLEKLEKDKENNDLFSGVGSSLENNKEDDMSWLNEL